MAVHDYVIANGTGSAVRSDLNNALAAIVSNNSSSTEPATTYAYQWWADTNDNVLKIRNSANNAWITLRELDGTMLIEDGSAALPGLAFADDKNSGIFSPANNQIGFATNGAERLEIGTSEVVFNDPSNDVDFRVESNGETHMLFVDAGNDRVGIGDPTPSQKLNVAGNVMLEGGDQYLYLTNAGTGNSGIYIRGNTASSYLRSHSTGIFTWEVTGSEKIRIDSSGRLLVGETSTSVGSTMVLSGRSDNATGGSRLYMSTATTSPASGSQLGGIYFSDDSENAGAVIDVQRDGGTWTSGSSHPSRIAFGTTADGASNPTQRMRISSDGLVRAYGDGNSFFAASAQAAGTTFATFACRHSATSTTTGTTSFQVLTNGNAQNTNNSYGAISDIKLKENIVDANSQWDDLKALQIRKYNFIEGETHTQLGVVAQEVETVSPGLVYETTDRDEEGNDLGTVTKNVNYSVLYMKAVKALQEAMDRIETLEAKVAALEAG